MHLVKVRAEAMQYCSELARSGMMTVFFGADNDVSLAVRTAQKWIGEKHDIETPVCQVANYLYMGAKVIAGHDEVTTTTRKNLIEHIDPFCNVVAGPRLHRAEQG